MPLILALQSAAASTPAAVVSTVNRFTDFLLGYVGALAAVGALSMALIEAGKKVWDSRTRFQALRWTEWMQGSVLDANLAVAAPNARAQLPVSRSTAYGELFQLCTGVPLAAGIDAAERLFASGGHLPKNHAFERANYPAHALFALDLEHMLGSIQEAADVALASPRQIPSLYLLMTAGADPLDVQLWYQRGPDSLIAIPDPQLADRQAIKEQADQLARLHQIVKRKLDGFQVYAGDKWASWNQTAANLMGFAALLLILLWIKNDNPIGSPSYGSDRVVVSVWRRPVTRCERPGNRAEASQRKWVEMASGPQNTCRFFSSTCAPRWKAASFVSQGN